MEKEKKKFFKSYEDISKEAHEALYGQLIKNGNIPADYNFLLYKDEVYTSWNTVKQNSFKKPKNGKYYHMLNRYMRDTIDVDNSKFGCVAAVRDNTELKKKAKPPSKRQ